MNKENLKEFINKVDFEKQKKFAQFSLMCVVDLYKLFETMVEHEKLEKLSEVNGAEMLSDTVGNLSIYANETIDDKI